MSTIFLLVGDLVLVFDFLDSFFYFNLEEVNVMFNFMIYEMYFSVCLVSLLDVQKEHKVI